MTRTYVLVLALAVLTTMTVPAAAHPGATASDGCHYCRTNCAKWGVPEGVRHCHYAPEQEDFTVTSHERVAPAGEKAERQPPLEIL